jgi:hypothetical protein
MTSGLHGKAAIPDFGVWTLTAIIESDCPIERPRCLYDIEMYRLSNTFDLLDKALASDWVFGNDGGLWFMMGLKITSGPRRRWDKWL